MNPFASEFVPMNSKTSKNNKNKTKALDRLAALSKTVAENVLPISHLPKELPPKELPPKELPPKELPQPPLQPIQIPTITSIDGLEQVAQISTTHGVYELFWNGTHAILDNRTSSWQFPDISIRHILQSYFGDFSTDSLSLDVPASYAPAIQVTLTLYD